MKRFSFAGAFAAASLMVLAACDKTPEDSTIVRACLQVADELAKNGLRDIADDRSRRFLGKVEEYRARCRGGEAAVAQMDTPWVDWANYWATGGASSKATRRTVRLPAEDPDRDVGRPERAMATLLHFWVYGFCVYALG